MPWKSGGGLTRRCGSRHIFLLTSRARPSSLTTPPPVPALVARPSPSPSLPILPNAQLISPEKPERSVPPLNARELQEQGAMAAGATVEVMQRPVCRSAAAPCIDPARSPSTCRLHHCCCCPCHYAAYSETHLPLCNLFPLKIAS